MRHAEKANAQIGTFGFADIPIAIGAKAEKRKEPIFLTHAQTDQQEKERKVY